MREANGIEGLLRETAPQALAAVARRHGDFADAEDAVQEALVAAAEQWPRDGVPDSPVGWLVHVASRRLVDQARSESARRRREEEAAAREPAEAPPDAPDHDDTLVVMFLAAHPSLSPSSAIALTLRAVAGLTTAEIAQAFLVPEATMAQRISRAKKTVGQAGEGFALPSAAAFGERLRTVLHVLYLIFNEGYVASSGAALAREELSSEAIRLARMVRRARPRDPEVTGLLALMLLTEARRAARTDPRGELVPLDAQDRSAWDRALIAEGIALLGDALARGAVGPYQAQAAIAAAHDRAATAEDTDWREILGWYEVLSRMGDNPMVGLSRAVALAMVEGPEAGLGALDGLRGALGEHHRWHAVRAHLLERAGAEEAAAEAYAVAAARTASEAENRYLTLQAARLGAGRAAGA